MQYLEYTVFLVMTVANVLGAIMLLLGLFADELENISKFYKAAFIFGATGLMWQAFRNGVYLLTGTAMSDSELPLWYLKDLGWVVIGFYFAYLMKNKELTLNHKE